MKKLSFLVAALCATTMALNAEVKTVILDGSATGLSATATDKESTISQNGFSYTMSKGGKQAVANGSNKFTDVENCILIGKKGTYIYNTTAFGSKITKLELYANKGASKNVEVSVSFSAAQPITAASADAWTQKLSTEDLVYTVTVPDGVRYFYYTVTNDYNSQVAFRITYDDSELPATNIVLDKTELSLNKGTTAQLTATLTPANATTEVVWASDKEDVATVANGLVTAVSAGSATITATAGTYEATCIVTVADAPYAPTFSVAEGTYKAAQSVELACVTDGAKVYYTLDGTTPDATSTLYESAISITKTTTIKAVAIKDGISSNIASATYTIVESVDNLAAFIKKADKTTPYVVASECVVTYQLDVKNVYVQDETAGILIYLSGGGLAIYKAGDRLTGIVGKYTTFSDQVELIPEIAFMPEPVAGEALTPAEKTILDLTQDIQNQYIKLSGVKFANDFTAKKGSVGTTPNVSKDGNEVKVYNKFKILAGDYKAASTYDIVGIVTYYDGAVNVYPIEVSEVTSPVTALVAPEMANIYATQGTIEGLGNTGRIFTVSGMEVTSQNGSLASGIYIVKLGEQTQKISVK